ncbi:MAG: GerMN domain-containing protein [Armatimonadetes bacterium]|nr:GerMN domain-containing protein [Armatimonadota bacterium]
MNVSAKSPVLPLLGALMLAVALPLQAAPTAQSPVPAQEAISSLISAPSSPLPPGTKLRSVTISDGLATVDFSRALKDNFRGGDTQEAQTVNAILRTLGQFPTVSKVQILVEGQRVDSLGGLIVISDPLPVVRPSAEQSSRYLHRRTHAQSNKAQR